MTDLLKEPHVSDDKLDVHGTWEEYTFPETDAALGSGAFGTVMKVTHNGRALKAFVRNKIILSTR